MNVACGGTLYQDLPSEFDSGVDHHQRSPYDRPVHGVRLEAGTPLFAELGVDDLAVNSYHHQAIRVLGEGLTAMAVSADGLVEAIDRPAATYFRAVQWHPEFLNSYHHQAIRVLGEGLTAMAVSADGLVEAIDRPAATYFRAVQWHPEFLYTVDEPSRRLFRSFVTACAR